MKKATEDQHRRMFLCLALSTAISVRAPASVVVNPEKLGSPKIDDLLVFAYGARRGAEIYPRDLRASEPPVIAWPMDPKGRVIKDGSRLNQLLLVRPNSPGPRYSGATSLTEGVICFSAICTHASCLVSEWNSEGKYLRCPCHGSEYDPINGAAVVFGPAPRPLPSLALKVVNGMLRIAGSFTERVGGSSSRTD